MRRKRVTDDSRQALVFAGTVSLALEHLIAIRDRMLIESAWTLT
jgi:hypothetical protein